MQTGCEKFCPDEIVRVNESETQSDGMPGALEEEEGATH